MHGLTPSNQTPDATPPVGSRAERFPSRRSVLAATASTLAAVSLGRLALPDPAAAAVPPPPLDGTPLGPVVHPLPLELVGLGSSRQVVVAQTMSWTEIHGTIEAWELGSDDLWRQVLAPGPSNVGLYGWVLGSQRIQGDLRTPAGNYLMHKAFGYSPDPGSGLPYHQLTPNDYWAGDQRDPKTYNIFQRSHPPTALWRASQSESLYYGRPAYEYVAPIDFNNALGVHRASDGEYVATTPADIRRGSGIFLHCYGVTGPNGYTLGCVNTSPERMAWLLRWFDPASLPRIVMGPSAVIRTLSDG